MTITQQSRKKNNSDNGTKKPLLRNKSVKCLMLVKGWSGQSHCTTKLGHARLSAFTVFRNGSQLPMSNNGRDRKISIYDDICKDFRKMTNVFHNSNALLVILR